MLTKQERLILICNEVLFGAKSVQKGLFQFTASELEEVCDYAQGHGLMVILASSFDQIDTSEEETTDLQDTKIGYFLLAKDIKAQYRDMKESAIMLARMLQDNGLDVMFMKGATLAQFYPKKSWRNCSDIDCYLYGRQQEVFEVLRKAQVDVYDTHMYHGHAELKDVSIELHQQFLEVGEVRTNAVVQEALASLAETEGRKYPSQWLPEDIHRAYDMTPTMNAIFLLRHMSKHFVWETVLLRQLYDWGLFLKHQGHLVNWQRVEQVYEEAGMTDFARRILAIVTDRMKMPVGDCCPLTPLDDQWTELMWQTIYSIAELSPFYKIPIIRGFYRRSEFLRNKWRFHITYSRDSYWRTWWYVFLRAFKTIYKDSIQKF